MKELIEFTVEKVEPMLVPYGTRKKTAFEYVTIHINYAYPNQELAENDIIKLHDGNLYGIIEMKDRETLFVCLIGKRYILEKHTNRLLGEGTLNGKFTIK